MTERTEPPWDELDDGIRETVRALWDAGFAPTDSGDGSKAATMECAFDVHHVFMICAPGELVTEADRLAEMIKGWRTGVDYIGNAIEANYSPADGVGVLALFGTVAR